MADAARPSRSRDLAMIAVFAGLMAALGLLPPIPIPLSPVPITAQSLGVMLAGSIIGARRGAGALLLFLALVAIGLPLLSGGRGGLGVFMGPSVGFLVGWVVCAWFIGLVTERLGAPYTLAKGLVANVLGGIVLLYVCGIAGVLVRTGMTLKAALLSNVPYLVGDAIKVVIASLVALGVHRAYPGLLASRRVGASR
ncbi:biotin transporter BioY [Luteococcus peritonei]|uniref:Biotin transporter n=1 Tax=Luteococcus peritonei TaxID=88874 RepID=A0ABW4RX79_9ACTN